MKTRAPLAALAAFVLVACAGLFEEPVQCKTDGDCARFAAVCDVTQGVCTKERPFDPNDATSPDPNRDGGPTPTPDGGEGGAPDPCDVPNKPDEVFPPGSVGGDVDVTASMTLDCKKNWILKGTAFVQPGVTITVEAGTTVRGDKATSGRLYILRGAKLVADGTRDKPIVFTSTEAAPQAGDWGGIGIMGSAPTTSGTPNLFGDVRLPFGGVVDADDSGVLRFVRVEYAQVGIHLAGLGSATKIDSVMVRKTNDNCFFFYGGRVDAKHLVCQSPADDMFEWGFGYAGRMQFLFGHLTPTDALVFGANGMLVDGSTPVIRNATLCGSAADNNSYGLVMRDDTSLDLANAIFTGWNAALDAQGTSLANKLTLASSIAFQNRGANPAFLENPAVMDPDSFLFDDDFGFDEVAWFNTAGRNNTTADPKLVGCFDPKDPKPWPATPLTAGAATPPADGFFDAGAAFVGAFRDQNDAWMRGAWVRFDDK